MNKLQQKQPVWFAVIWIFIYVAIDMIGKSLSSKIGIADLMPAIFLTVLSIFLIFYLFQNKLTGYYGIKMLKKKDYKNGLFFIPLLIMASLQYFRGLNPAFGVKEVLISILLMLNVGFLEELIFRGFLYKGILSESNIKRAVIISGVTFGIGHIVNLLNGYTGAEQVLQILAGIILGINLALVVAVTDSIIPCALFHTLLNIGGHTSREDIKIEYITLAIMAVITLFYSIYLIRILKKRKAAEA